jgi:glutamate carboxypeptidase
VATNGDVALLRELVEIESPTGFDEGVRGVGDVMERELGARGAAVRRLGGHICADLDGRGEPILVLGHLDTVWPTGTLGSMPFRLEDGRAYGPGAYDMKAGLVSLVAALDRAGTTRRAVRVFLTADEETGSVEGRPLLEEAARGVAAALVLEPPTSSGALKTARKGVGRFRVLVRGRESHAGTNPDEGVSAVEELAHQVLRLRALADADAGISVNVGVVEGGSRRNVVPGYAEAAIDVRVARAADVARMESALRALRPELDGTSIEVRGRFTRPPLERSPGSARLFERAREHGRALGLDLGEAASGGASDGNLVAALGVPVLDGLGPRGGGAHARHEHVLVDSLPERAGLLARLLEDPGL